MQRRDILAITLVMCGTLLGVAIGYYAGRNSHQNANEMIGAGFTVIDPEGYEIESFDEGFCDMDYWTTTDRR